MCNRLHPSSKAINTEGIGYKIFVKNYYSGEPELTPVFGLGKYEVDADGYIKWDDGLYHKLLNKDNKYGFCFFLTEGGAKKALKAICRVEGYDYLRIFKIKYRKGLGKHIEDETITAGLKITIALCREFKVIDE